MFSTWSSRMIMKSIQLLFARYSNGWEHTWMKFMLCTHEVPALL
ncbi:unnamed protein product, partial [Allacma fusca]